MRLSTEQVVEAQDLRFNVVVGVFVLPGTLLVATPAEADVGDPITASAASRHMTKMITAALRLLIRDIATP
ncbi:MAG: hypothetical protein AVDCRST_MAG75-2728 [uncultured Propionibacteriaceae bacterium]|uniref:Uncharacterized protein n=1 Tax=uncultured Propionibacteriaceae bacterium TaxID=257457 RepID=A0A6J4PI26_9ACTN|nr:MAG: hypothetical protein AVDCRST_MAG75-2728 [uncultured Propionibacteriaceae bacterium]